MRLEAEIGTLIWIVVFRVDAKNEQQQSVKYTEEAANTFAKAIQDNGGIAIVIEDFEANTVDREIYNLNNPSRGKLTW